MGQRESVKKYLRNVSLIYVFFGFKHLLYKCKDMRVGLSENMFVIQLIKLLIYKVLYENTKVLRGKCLQSIGCSKWMWGKIFSDIKRFLILPQNKASEFTLIYMGYPVLHHHKILCSHNFNATFYYATE